MPGAGWMPRRRSSKCPPHPKSCPGCWRLRKSTTCWSPSGASGLTASVRCRTASVTRRRSALARPTGARMSEGFLGRWSRRKQAVQAGQPVQEPPSAPAVEPAAADPVSARPVVPAAASLSRDEAPGQTATTPAPQPPSLEDTQVLTPQSDFRPFMARDVAPEVKNAAMKKLFADPHFNVMDGLDIYIADYTQPDPLPAAMLRQMTSAQFLNLAASPPASADPAAQAELPVAPSFVTYGTASAANAA